ncbi:MAG: Crp/Fnr family transcriptional regulator [Saprospiraceae bacterium]|nr:Crp/Fnr family transcriptional regulator [Saprospiraceae bacterium]
MSEEITSCYYCKNKSSCFNKLNQKDLDFAFTKRVELSFRKGETLFKQGGFATHIIFIKSGLVKVFIEGKQKDLILGIMTSGSLLGLQSLFNEDIYSYSVAAYENTQACQIDISSFRDFASKNAEFSKEIIKSCNINTSYYFKRFYTVSNKTVTGRFADVILYLSELVYKNDKFATSLSRKEIADFGGMSIESLSRVINDFNSEKIIKVSGKNFEILNPVLLKKISESG